MYAGVINCNMLKLRFFYILFLVVNIWLMIKTLGRMCNTLKLVFCLYEFASLNVYCTVNWEHFCLRGKNLEHVCSLGAKL